MSFSCSCGSALEIVFVPAHAPLDKLVEFADEELRKMSRQEESGFSSSDVELNDTVKSMLNIIYHQDFQQFGYKPDLVADVTDIVDGLPAQRWSRPIKKTPAFFKWILCLFNRR